MLSSFYSGISGLNSNSQQINVVGNNIANVNTIGYKAQRASFEDVLYQSIYGTSGTSQVGRGSALASVDTLFSQGSFESTSEPTDLAIGGQGFFIVKNPENNTNYYTRAGQFRFDKEGQMTNSAGDILQGKAIDRITNSAFGVDTDIIISPEPSEPRRTARINMVTNLQSNAAWKGSVSALSAIANNLQTVRATTGKYPIATDVDLHPGMGYAATITNRNSTTDPITHTGSNDVTFNINGTLSINGVNITLSGISTLTGAGSLVATINTALAAASVPITASATGSALTLTVNAAAANDGTDIVVDDSGLTSGSIGWSDSDKASTDLYGSNMSMVTTWTTPDGTVRTKTYTAPVSTHRGTLTNWAGSGLDITAGDGSGYVLDETTQTFDVSGFQPKYVSATSNPSTTSDYSSSITAYDSLGQPHVVTVYFRKAFEETVGSAQSNVWEWHAMISGADSATGLDTEVRSGYLTFNNNGVLTTGGDPVTATFNFSMGAEQGQKVDLVFGSASGGGSTTQYPIASKTSYQSQDGYPPGVLENVTVSQEGIISGHYSNGQILDLYQLTLANFNNLQGLKREGGNLYSETLESGTPVTNPPGNGGLGKINPNSLEQSNVDLATEFVKMIIAQRGYQANSRVITTTDEILQELMNLKR